VRRPCSFLCQKRFFGHLTAPHAFFFCSFRGGAGLLTPKSFGVISSQEFVPGLFASRTDRAEVLPFDV